MHDVLHIVNQEKFLSTYFILLSESESFIKLACFIFFVDYKYMSNHNNFATNVCINLTQLYKTFYKTDHDVISFLIFAFSSRFAMSNIIQETEKNNAVLRI